MQDDNPMSCAELPTEALVWEALKTVIDPELGFNLVDLGLIYSVEIAERAVTIRDDTDHARLPHAREPRLGRPTRRARSGAGARGRCPVGLGPAVAAVDDEPGSSGTAGCSRLRLITGLPALFSGSASGAWPVG